MKAILLGDIHFSDVFLHRKDNIRDAFMRKFDFIGKTASQIKADAIISTGDIFHYKYPARTSHGLMQFIMQTLKWLPCPFYSNVGNHDISYNDINTLMPKQPLGVLFQSGMANPLTLTPVVIGDTEIYGIAYGADISQVELPDKEAKFRIVVLHTFTAHDPGLFYGAERIWSFNELKKFNADVILNGHDHQIYDPVFIPDHCALVRPGSLFRYSRNTVDLGRQPYLIVWDSEHPAKIETIQIPAPKSADVFHVMEKQIREWARNDVSSFVDDLGNFKLVKPGSLSEDVAKLDLPEDVRAELETYIESAR